MKQQYDDTFLARWLANELTEQELLEFENSEDFGVFKAIADTTSDVEVSSFDVESNLIKTRSKLKQTKKRRVIPIWSYAAAASIVLLFFTYSMFFSMTEYTTEFGENKSVVLPDNSEVVLNAVSNLSYKNWNWEENRALELQGEAYFKVEKGSSFKVRTSEGVVEVLGTLFKVTSRDHLYSVVCYEGKVQVVTKSKDSIVLTKGKSVRIANNKLESSQTSDLTPSWLADESSFENAPIQFVLNELERQYNISILGKEKLKSSYFTGRFPNSDLSKALRIVFVTMDIQYKKDDDGNVVIL